MKMRLSQIRGMEPDTAKSLRTVGIKDSEKVLTEFRTPQARKEWAVKLGMDDKALLELANRADLARVKGIGRVYANLLENCGVDTVAELAQRNPANLYEKLVANAAESGVQRAPRKEDVADWIAQAKQLGRGIEY